MDITDVVKFLGPGGGGLLGFLLGTLVAGANGWWVFGRVYDAEVRRGDRLEKMLEQALSNNEQLLQVLEPEPRRRSRL